MSHGHDDHHATPSHDPSSPAEYQEQPEVDAAPDAPKSPVWLPLLGLALFFLLGLGALVGSGSGSDAPAPADAPSAAPEADTPPAE